VVAFLKISETFLAERDNMAKSVFPHARLLHNVLERWLLLFGILFILVVVFFPERGDRVCSGVYGGTLTSRETLITPPGRALKRAGCLMGRISGLFMTFLPG